MKTYEATSSSNLTVLAVPVITSIGPVVIERAKDSTESNMNVVWEPQIALDSGSHQLRHSKEKGQPLLSGRPAFFFITLAEPVSLLKEAEATGPACALAETKKLDELAGVLRGTRSPERSPRQIFRIVYPMAHRSHHRVLAVRHPVHSNRPGAMQHVQAPNQCRNRQESERKQRKGGQQFLHKVYLRRCNASQQPPHPLSALVSVFHLLEDPCPHKTLPLAFPLLLRFFTPLRCNHLPEWAFLPDLYH